MAASYKKLWKLLIDKEMRKEDLRLKAGITTTAMAKLGRNETVHMDILLKICKCDLTNAQVLALSGTLKHINNATVHAKILLIVNGKGALFLILVYTYTKTVYHHIITAFSIT